MKRLANTGYRRLPHCMELITPTGLDATVTAPLYYLYLLIRLVKNPSTYVKQNLLLSKVEHICVLVLLNLSINTKFLFKISKNRGGECSIIAYYSYHLYAKKVSDVRNTSSTHDDRSRLLKIPHGRPPTSRSFGVCIFSPLDNS